MATQAPEMPAADPLFQLAIDLEARMAAIEGMFSMIAADALVGRSSADIAQFRQVYLETPRPDEGSMFDTPEGRADMARIYAAKRQWLWDDVENNRKGLAAFRVAAAQHGRA